jgi:Uma2 family endonuclease
MQPLSESVEFVQPVEFLHDAPMLVRSGATVAEYMAFEDTTETRHEFHDGDIITMPGASPFHENLIAELISILRAQLHKPAFTIYGSGLKIAVPTYNRILYPDLSIVRGEPVFESDGGYRLVNPTLVIEVLSPSTAEFDLTEKFEYYRSIASLQEIVYFEAERPFAQLFRKNAAGRWEVIDIEGGVVELASVQASISLADLYPSQPAA